MSNLTAPHRNPTPTKVLEKGERTPPCYNECGVATIFAWDEHRNSQNLELKCQEVQDENTCLRRELSKLQEKLTGAQIRTDLLCQREEQFKNDIINQRKVLRDQENTRASWQSKIDSLNLELHKLKSRSVKPIYSRSIPRLGRPTHTVLPETQSISKYDIQNDLLTLMSDDKKKRHLLRLLHPDGHIGSNKQISEAAQRVLHSVQSN